MDGQRVHGLFDNMMKGEHKEFERYLSYMGEWAHQCQTVNISAGWYFSVVPSGCGKMQFTHKKLGPFNRDRPPRRGFSWSVFPLQLLGASPGNLSQRWFDTFSIGS